MDASTQFWVNIIFRESCGALTDESLLVVQLHSSAGLVIEVQRSCAQVQSFLHVLNGKVADITGVMDAQASVQILLQGLRDAFTSQPEIAEEPWSCVALVEFLDGAPRPNILGSSVITTMQYKIKSLVAANQASLAMVRDLQAQFSELARQVQSLQQGAQIQRRSTLDSTTGDEQGGDYEFESPPQGMHKSYASVSSVDDGDCRGGHSRSQSSDGLDSLLLNVPIGAVTESEIGASAKLSGPSRFNPSAPAFNPKGAAPEPPSSPHKNAEVLPSCELLSADLYAQLPHEEVMQRAVLDIVNALCPQQSQVHYRDSVVALIQRNFRIALNCEALEVGLHRLLCFLPDDPVRVSAVVCRNHATKWHRVICDRLSMIAKKRSDDPAGQQEGYTYRSDQRDETEDATGDHVIRNVLISNTKLCIQVQCSVDNTEVELSCNARADVCMLALLEEMSTLVGKGDLFKQSVMLIRAWWCCETAAYVGTTVKNYLTDLSLCVMICAIFNVHHARIRSPLQALCAFLAEYAAYDGNTHAISIMGIVPFKSASSNQPVLPAPLNPTYTGAAAAGDTASPVLLTREVLERYWLLFCPPDPSNPEQQQPKILPSLSSSSEDVFGIDLRGVANGNLSLEIASIASSLNDATPQGTNGAEEAAGTTVEDAALAAHRQQCNRNLVKFDRSQFNVVDPFSCNNMVLERPSQNRILRLTKVFHSGAQQMAALLAQARAAPEPLDAMALLKTFFPMCFTRFVDASSRPDTFPVDASFLTPAMVTQMTKRIPMQVSIDELCRQMRYCNLMVESVISRTAVLDLVVEILTQKGPLPIGEVGKALAELTCITGLSARLKEAYGGLKKFLEDYSNVVIIGTDHPFNPHIVLRASLSAENLALNDSGVFPTHAVLRMKKVTATSLRRNAYQSQGMVNKPNMPAPAMTQHQQGYRPGPPMAAGGIGMGGPRPGVYHDPRMGVAPQAMHQAYPPQQHQQQMMMPPAGPPHQQYTAKILSNLHADAREREMGGYRPQPHPSHVHGPQGMVPQHGQQSLQQQQMHQQRGLERHGSGSSHSMSHGSMGGSASHNSSGHQIHGESSLSFMSGATSVGSASNDAFEDGSGMMPPVSPGSNYTKPFGGRDPAYPPPHGQPYGQHSPSLQGQFPEMGGYDGAGRPRVDSGPRGNYPPPHSGNQRAPEMLGHAYQQQYPSQQQHQGAYGYERGPAAPGGMAQASPRDRYLTNSPSTSGFGIDNSFFDSSAGPLLSEPLALDGPRSASGSFHQRGSSFGSNNSLGISLDRLENAGPSPGNTSRGSARGGSLLSGLREGSLELSVDGSSPSWDLFPPQSQQQDYLGGSEWRSQNHSHQERKF